jgi:hypothetical protein
MCWKSFTAVECDLDERPEIDTVWVRKIRHDFRSHVIGSLYDPVTEPKAFANREPGHTASHNSHI